MSRAITPETILAEVSDIAEAKAIAAGMRRTAVAVEHKYGMEHPIAREFTNRYFDFVDALAEAFA